MSAPYLSVLSVSGWRSSDEPKGLHPSGQATPSGSTAAVRTAGVRRFGGSGQTFSSVLSSSSPSALSTDFSSSSASLMRLVLISRVGRSAGGKSDHRFYHKGNMKSDR